MEDRRRDLIRFLEETRQEVVSLVRSLSPKELALILHGAWSVKDGVAHLASSEAGLLATATRIAAGQEAGRAGFDLDFYNQRQVEKRQGRSVDELVREMETSRADLLRTLEQMTDAQLAASGRLASGLPGDVLWVLRRIGEHERSHCQEIREAVGRRLRLEERIRDIPDFPQKGVIFKDITPLIKDPIALRQVIDDLTQRYRERRVDVVVAMESRGFIFGAPLAYSLGAGFVPVRKEGKLPWETLRAEYSLEYGTSTLEIHKDAIAPGQRVLVVDDLLATGGTVEATIRLVEQLGGQVVGVAFLIELTFLHGVERLRGYDVVSLVRF